MTHMQFQNKLAKFLYCKGLLTESEFWNRMDELCEDAFDLHNCKLAQHFKDAYFNAVNKPHAQVLDMLNDVCEMIDQEWAQQLRNAE